MRATWRVTSAISMPQASGSSNARRNETCRPPSTIAARSTSAPPCSSAVGGCAARRMGWLSRSMLIGLTQRYLTALAASTTSATDGSASFSRLAAYGIGTSLPRDARDRRIEIVEGMLHDARGDFGADAGLRPALFDRDAAAGLLHRLDDGLGVHRAQRAQVDHLGLDALRPAPRRPSARRSCPSTTPPASRPCRAARSSPCRSAPRSRRPSAPGRTGRRGSRSPGRPPDWDRGSRP